MHTLGVTQEEEIEVRKIDLIKDDKKRTIAVEAWEKKIGKKFPRSVCHGYNPCPAMQKVEDETFRELFPFAAPIGKDESAW
jgi:hypothetical protein